MSLQCQPTKSNSHLYFFIFHSYTNKKNREFGGLPSAHFTWPEIFFMARQAQIDLKCQYSRAFDCLLHISSSRYHKESHSASESAAPFVVGAMPSRMEQEARLRQQKNNGGGLFGDHIVPQPQFSARKLFTCGKVDRSDIDNNDLRELLAFFLMEVF